MKNCKRPLMSCERDFFQRPTDASEEEIQRGCRFVKRLKTMDHERIFDPYVDVMKSYQSGSLSYTDLKNRLVFILGNHNGLVGAFHQLFLDPISLVARKANKDSAKPNLERSVQFFNKSEALKWRQVTPSYYLRPEAEKRSSSDGDDEVLNNVCVSIGQFDPVKVVKRSRSPPLHCQRMNVLEETLYEEDMFLKPLTSVIKFGDDVFCEKPPEKFYEVVEWFYGAKKVPKIFKIHPKLAVQGILHKLKIKEKEMRKEKEIRQKKFATKKN